MLFSIVSSTRRQCWSWPAAIDLRFVMRDDSQALPSSSVQRIVEGQFTPHQVGLDDIGGGEVVFLAHLKVTDLHQHVVRAADHADSYLRQAYDLPQPTTPDSELPGTDAFG